MKDFFSVPYVELTEKKKNVHNFKTPVANLCVPAASISASMSKYEEVKGLKKRIQSEENHGIKKDQTKR